MTQQGRDLPVSGTIEGSAGWELADARWPIELAFDGTVSV
jgi:hypothetical protein